MNFIYLLSFAFCIGILAGSVWQLAPLWILVATALLIGVSLFQNFRQKSGIGLIIAAALLSGWGRVSVVLQRPVPRCSAANHVGRKRFILTATVVRSSEPMPHGSRALVEGHLALLRGIKDKEIPLCGVIELRLAKGGPNLVKGDVVMFRSRLRPAVGPRTPGAPSSWLRFQRDAVQALARADASALVVIERGHPGFIDSIRKRIRRALEKTLPDEKERGLLAAVLLGERGGISPEVKQDFARAGTSHLLAVSGMHLTLLAGAFFFLLHRLLLHIPWIALRTDVRRLAGPMAAGVAILYTLLTGCAPSAMRACAMAVSCFLALAWMRPSEITRSLSFSALVVLALSPLDLFSPGFQLSFIAVVGLILVMRRKEDHFFSENIGRVKRWLKTMLMTSIAATLLTAPILAHHFALVSWAGVMTNFIGVPLTSLAMMPLGFIGALLGAIDPQLGKPFLLSAGFCARQLSSLSHAVAAWEGSAFNVHLGWLACFGCLALGIALLAKKRQRRVVGLLAIGLLSTALVKYGCQRLPKALEVTVLDVGQGDSIFVRFPEGKNLLVDGGGGLLKTYDPGAALVVPFLRAHNVRHLDLVVLSHPHPDHIQGLGAVLDHIDVDELWVCWHVEPSMALEALLEKAKEKAVKVSQPRPLVWGDSRIQPLWPVGYDGFCADPGYSANDNSIVLKIKRGAASMLLAGDIEEDAERELVKRYGAKLKADLLKVPHHGSPTSSTTGFLQAVKPRLAVISCAAKNSFGFPSQEVLSRLRQQGATIARTDQLGAIGVRFIQGEPLSWKPLTTFP